MKVKAKKKTQAVTARQLLLLATQHVFERVSIDGLGDLAMTVLARHAPKLKLPALRVSSRMTRTFGSYTPTTRQVSLSSRLLAFARPSEKREILLHELAHAITHHRFPKASAHGAEFRAICREIGADGRRFVSLPVREWAGKGRWAAVCDHCGSLVTRQRAVSVMRCGCGNRIAPRRLAFIVPRPDGVHTLITTRTLR
ncbi:MAG: SprT-like domain-containing protein [Chloroflexi bacterium]|nr:SprT-like domain-containing protein [Chloroflexota bacterium]